MKKSLVGICVSLCVLTTAALAGSATWSAAPGSSDWNSAANWTPATVPNGMSDKATFDVSTVHSVALSAATVVSGIVFNTDADSYTVTSVAPVTLRIVGLGIANNSANTQFFYADPGSNGIQTEVIVFKNSATAGSGAVYTAAGAVVRTKPGALIAFHDNADAGSATFLPQNGTIDGAFGGQISFRDNSSAATATFITPNSTGNLGSAEIDFQENSTAGAATFMIGGSNKTVASSVSFLGSSTAENAIITLNGGSLRGTGGLASFLQTATAGAATIIAQPSTGTTPGGAVFFEDDSTGGTVRVELFGTGLLSIQNHNAPGVTIGSLEGTGTAYIFGVLTIGSNNLSTTMSGPILGYGSTLAGSVVKIGTGTLTLGGASTYAEGTTVSAGTLAVANTTGSATGSGAVQVNGGTLGGPGSIAGAATIGNGTDSAALVPRVDGNTPTTTTIQGMLNFQNHATYVYNFRAKGHKAESDGCNASGITIAPGARVNLKGQAKGTLPAGTTFLVINNTAATPIGGTFSNLPDDAVLTLGGNHLQASYSGGDGNDLTLTVVQ